MTLIFQNTDAFKPTEANAAFNTATKLENPYTVENMQQALDNIRARVQDGLIDVLLDTGIQDFEIDPSHYYIKFSPQDAEQEGRIKADSTLIVFDYPLDYEFTDEQLANRTLAEGKLPEYYTSVTLDKELPQDVPFEILETLYIPEEDPFFNQATDAELELPTDKTKIESYNDLFRHLLYEAYELTSNEEDLQSPDEESSSCCWIFGSRWQPNGKLQFWDDAAGTSTTTRYVFSHYATIPCNTLPNNPDPDDPQYIDEPLPLPWPDGNGPDVLEMCKRPIYRFETVTLEGMYVPLEGAQVLMRQWFTVAQGITDRNGDFSTRKLRGKARYVIQWERYHYSIRNGTILQAETKGPKVKDRPWIHNIKGGEDEYHAMIHTAAHTYYYGPRFGLISPPTNALLRKQMKIAARKANSRSNHIHQRRFIHLAQIHLKEWEEPGDKVFGTTIHELAHAAHWSLDRNSYNNLIQDGYLTDFIIDRDGDARVLESWATVVEYQFLLDRYNRKFQQDYVFEKNNLQSQTIAEEDIYTSAGIDMMDNKN